MSAATNSLGMDVAVFAGGKIRTLYTFVEAPVAAAA